ncbi:MAG: peptidoglycan-binding domain-containing protein [Cyanobacteria bacterium P01_H01_bin.26]
MPKLLTAAAVAAMVTGWWLPSHAQTTLLAPPPPPLPSPSGFNQPQTSPVGEQSLQIGDIGDDVAALQRALDRSGINPGPIDGDYGPLTSDAVRQFQQWQGLPITGIADAETLDSLGVDVSNEVVVVVNDAGDAEDDRHYVAAVTESTRSLGQVQRFFGNAAIDSARQGQFINIGRYSSHSSAVERVREARRFGFNAQILYKP